MGTLKALNLLDNVVNVDIINGPYDLVVEIIFDTMDDLKESFVMEEAKEDAKKQ